MTYSLVQPVIASTNWSTDVKTNWQTMEDVLSNGVTASGTVNASNVGTVALSSTNYTSIQSAINAIPTVTSTNPFVVWVLSGIYIEKHSMQGFVHILGVGGGSLSVV